MERITASVAVILSLILPSPALADYVIKLKNGRTVETDKVWEEKAEVKFHWQDGVASLPKKNIVSIVKVDEKLPNRAAKAKEPAPPAPPAKSGEGTGRNLKETPAPAKEFSPDDSAPKEITPKEVENYKKEKAYYTERFEQAHKRYLEASAARDKEAKQRAREEYNQCAGKVFALESEVAKRNNGTVPGWWKE